ncbi:MAG: glycosyltransferase involved in cell wall biosynthesis [Glaciecola sp.]|jgi:glycosyltransferase involved in cell wall biosynthesis
MLKGKKIAVVVPAFNEEKLILKVLSTIPKFVDEIVVVDDCSTDGTAAVVQKAVSISDTGSQSARITLIKHEKNLGVGGAISSGYQWCKDISIDCTAVMAADGQMDPNELASICEPVVNEKVDYVKGNRLMHKSAWTVIPKLRYFGNSILSLLTKVASGYWRIYDTQTGYTAISLEALGAFDISKLYKNYGVPNDLLVKLNMANCTIREIGIRPIYNVGEQSNMNFLKVIPRISLLLFKAFFKRLWVKYFFRNFHPLFIFYNLSFVFGLASMPYMYKIYKSFETGQQMNYEPLFAFVLLSVFSFQFFAFAMWMDIQDNERLYK